MNQAHIYIYIYYIYIYICSKSGSRIFWHTWKGIWFENEDTMVHSEGGSIVTYDIKDRRKDIHHLRMWVITRRISAVCHRLSADDVKGMRWKKVM